MAALVRLFAADVTSVSDGNGTVRIARRAVAGAQQVAKFMEAMSWFWNGVEVKWVSTTGQTSALLRHDGATVGMLTVGASGDGSDQVLWMFNPEKITELSLPAGLA